MSEKKKTNVWSVIIKVVIAHSHHHRRGLRHQCLRFLTPYPRPRTWSAGF